MYYIRDGLHASRSRFPVCIFHGDPDYRRKLSSNPIPSQRHEKSFAYSRRNHRRDSCHFNFYNFRRRAETSRAHHTEAVPAMALLYVVSGLVIILLHITSLPDVILNIVTGAFGLRPVLAGTAGSMIIAMAERVAAWSLFQRSRRRIRASHPFCGKCTASCGTGHHRRDRSIFRHIRHLHHLRRYLA